jgi:hypothetical protein
MLQARHLEVDRIVIGNAAPIQKLDTLRDAQLRQRQQITLRAIGVAHGSDKLLHLATPH